MWVFVQYVAGGGLSDLFWYFFFYFPSLSLCIFYYTFLFARNEKEIFLVDFPSFFLPLKDYGNIFSTSR